MLPAFIASVTSQNALLAWFEMFAGNDCNYYNRKFSFFQEGGPNSINLYEMTVQIISHSECNSTYVIFGGITDRMICAGDPNAEKGACWVIIIINYFGVVCWILG